MAFHLTVAGSLEPLAEAMGEVLSVPLADPFAPELVVVPGAGLRSWLTGRLSRTLGGTSAGDDGIVANVQYVFPATLVQRALGDDDALGRWSTGPLTWAVYDELCADAASYGEPGPDAVRARTIADLFDRYTLHRQSMALDWSDPSTTHFLDGVGQPVDEYQQWQPRLWRAVQARLGGPTDAQRLAELIERLGGDDLGDLRDRLPQRVSLFGLAGLPQPHLRVLVALSNHLDVHMFAPVASPARWAQLRPRLDVPLRLPVPRTIAETEHLVGDGHPLVTSWGRASREAHLLLLDVLRDAPSVIRVVEADVPEPTNLLERIQCDVLSDLEPPGASTSGDDARMVFDPTDDSVRWHRCYGAARQVEVLRDALRHLFEERAADGSARYQPRDVVVLTPDISTFAPLIEAAFAGDHEHGLDAIPLRVADRTLQQDNPLLDVASSLLALLDGRFRASDVLAFLSLDPVRRRFGLSGDAVGRIVEWARATNIKWGLDSSDQAAFGLPDDLGAWTFRDALDQLLLGATMADEGARLGIGDVVPFGDVEGVDVDFAGALSEFVSELRRAADELTRPGTVEQWSLALATSLRSLCELVDDDAGHWRGVERTIETFRVEALDGTEVRGHEVDPAELAELFRVRLGASGGGRPRFGTGMVTVSSLTALRGVPFSVVCLVGLDDEVGGSAFASAEDLIASDPCIGDRDPRSEQRAQLLDAVLAAGDRLLLFSNGHDIRTNAALAPVVAVADLVDVIDATARSVSGDERVSERIATDHPRQAWSVRSFQPRLLGVDGPWSFDAVALDAARRKVGSSRPSIFEEPLDPPVHESTDGLRVIELPSLERALTSPAEVLLRDRLGVSIPSTEEESDDHIPFALSRLADWKLGDELLRTEIVLDPDDRIDANARWAEVVRRRGDVAPFEAGDAPIADARRKAAAALSGLAEGLDVTVPDFRSESIDHVVDVGDGGSVRLFGTIAEVHGDTVVTVGTSSIKGKHLLIAWLHLAVLGVQRPERDWTALVVGAPRPKFRLRPGAAARVLEVVIGLHDTAMHDVVPFLPGSSRAELTGTAAKEYPKEWGYDRWSRALLPADLSELRTTPREHESGDGWIVTDDRFALWAARIWGTFDETVEFLGDDAVGDAADVVDDSADDAGVSDD